MYSTCRKNFPKTGRSTGAHSMKMGRKRGLNGARMGTKGAVAWRERKDPFNCPFKRARVSGR